jgi:hypothetical protein
VAVLTDVLQVFVDEPEATEVAQQVKSVFTPQGGVQQLLEDCEAVSAYSGNNYLPLLWRFYKSHRSAFLRLIHALKLESTSQDKTLMQALEFLLANAHRRGEWLPATVDISFASEQWQRLVLVRQGAKVRMVRRHFEVCVFSYLAAELKSGDICVLGSDTYADYRAQLLSWEECQPMVADYCQNLGFADTAIGFIKQLKSWLTDTANSVEEGYPDNRHVVINDQGKPVLKRPPRHEPSPTATIFGYISYK